MALIPSLAKNVLSPVAKTIIKKLDKNRYSFEYGSRSHTLDIRNDSVSNLLNNKNNLKKVQNYFNDPGKTEVIDLSIKGFNRKALYNLGAIAKSDPVFAKKYGIKFDPLRESFAKYGLYTERPLKLTKKEIKYYYDNYNKKSLATIARDLAKGSTKAATDKNKINVLRGLRDRSVFLKTQEPNNLLLKKFNPENIFKGKAPKGTALGITGAEKYGSNVKKLLDSVSNAEKLSSVYVGSQLPRRVLNINKINKTFPYVKTTQEGGVSALAPSVGHTQGIGVGAKLTGQEGIDALSKIKVQTQKYNHSILAQGNNKMGSSIDHNSNRLISQAAKALERGDMKDVRLNVRELNSSYDDLAKQYPLLKRNQMPRYRIGKDKTIKETNLSKFFDIEDINPNLKMGVDAGIPSQTTYKSFKDYFYNAAAVADKSDLNSIVKNAKEMQIGKPQNYLNIIKNIQAGDTTTANNLIRQASNASDQGKVFLNDGGRARLETGGRVYLAPGGKVYQPTSSSGNSRVGMFESILSGIGAGILDIPRGAFSLGASLIDLGAGTDTAADIEMWFDDLTTLDERAEATTAGKITRIMTNLGIPGTAAFKAGSRMARSAIEAKEAGTLYKFTKNTEGALEKTLTNKGRMRQTLGGVAGVGVSDAIFVGDAERIGTLGDAFNIGPTQLADNDENNAARSVMNRVKFGLDSAFLGGIIGGTGTAIKQAVQRSNNLNRNNDLIDKILEYTTPQGKKTKEFFEMEREMIGRRSADANKAQELQRQLDKEIDALYGQMGQKFGIGVQKERTALTKVVNDALVSSADGPKVTPIVNAEGLTEGATFTLGNMTPESLSALSKAKLKNPEEVIRILQRARRTMDKSFTDIASNVFRFGKSTKEAADDTLNRFAKFKTAFETKSLDYIDDTYRIFGNKNSEALKGFKPTAEAVTSAKEMFKQLALKRTGKTISDEQAAYEVERILVSSKKQNKFLVEGEAVPLLQDETGFLKDIAIKDWTKPMLPLNKVAGEAGEDILVNGLTPRKIIEDLFGKVQDPSATILSTLSDLSLVRRKHEFFGDFYDTMAGKQMFNTRREAAAVFGDNNVGEKAIQMLSTNPGGKLNIEAVNPLNGRWSSKGIQEALEEVNSGWTTVLDKDNVFTTFYNNFVLYPKATSQLAKTVLSPVTHFRNLISATAFASANGIMPLMNKEALDEAMGAFSQVGARGSEAANKRYRELLRLGVVNKNARLGDLEDLLDDVDFGTTKFTNKVMQNLGKKLNKGKEYATDLYTAEDDFWKMYTFAAERKRIKTALEKSGIDANVFARSADNDLGLVFKNGEEYLDEAAANIVRNNVPNYDYVSKFIKDLRKAPIGNFVSFPAEIIRTSINILGKGFKEFNYVDPITKTKPFRSMGMQRMAGFGATAVAIPYGTVEAFKAAYNVSGMEMDALRRFVPDWSKNSTLVPIKDDDGNFTYIDFSHANAYDTMIRPFKTIMNAVADGRTDNDTVMEDLIQGVVESTTELGSPFISEAIWTQALTDVFVRNGRTRDGRRLYTEQTPYGDRFAKGLFHLVEAQTPGSASTIGRLFNSIFEKPDKYGKQYDFTKEAAGIAGLRAVEINPVETMKYKIADYRTGINNSRREFTSPLLKGGVVTPEQIIDRYKLANESLYQVQKNMTKDFYGAMILGANEDSLKREFKDRVSNKALRGIIQGQFKPFIPSENIEKSFRDQARELGNNSPFARAKDTIRRLAAEYSKLKLFGDRLPDFTNPFAGENTVLSTEGITSRLPSLNLGLNSLGGSAINNTSLTQAKGSKVFGSNDTVFGS